MSAEELGKRLLGAVEEESLDDVRDVFKFSSRLLLAAALCFFSKSQTPCRLRCCFLYFFYPVKKNEYSNYVEEKQLTITANSY